VCLHLHPDRQSTKPSCVDSHVYCSGCLPCDYCRTAAMEGTPAFHPPDIHLWLYYVLPAVRCVCDLYRAQRARGERSSWFFRLLLAALGTLYPCIENGSSAYSLAALVERLGACRARSIPRRHVANRRRILCIFLCVCFMNPTLPDRRI
jgi:hypothetical protein